MKMHDLAARRPASPIPLLYLNGPLVWLHYQADAKFHAEECG